MLKFESIQFGKKSRTASITLKKEQPFELFILFILFYLFFLLMLTITEQILFTIKKAI